MASSRRDTLFTADEIRLLKDIAAAPDPGSPMVLRDYAAALLRIAGASDEVPPEPVLNRTTTAS